MLLIISSLAPSLVFADVRQFIPKISGYSAFLEVDSTYESDENSTSGRSAKRRDLFLKQLLDLSAEGYVYHPRFISYGLRLAAGIKEENAWLGDKSEFSTGASDEYEFRAMILPEHPYNLELFTLRLEPLVNVGFSAGSSQSVAYSSGAIFRYKKKPYFLNVHYLKNTGESSLVTYSAKRYGFNATLFKEVRGGRTHSFTASYDHLTSGSSENEGISDEGALNYTFASKSFNLSSGVRTHDSSQVSGLNRLSFSGQGFSWLERGRASLPWNLSADFSYGVTQDTTKTGGELTTAELSSRLNSTTFSLTHTLYDSLLSTYNFGYSELKSDSGNSNTLSNGLAFAYTKKIPYGRLRANVSGSRSETESEGVLSIPSEDHDAVQVPGRFTLNHEDVNVGTIIVWLKSPEVTAELVLLQPDVDYVITPLGTSVQIEIVNLPARFPLPGTYNFNVSYTVKGQNARYRTENLNYSVAFELFHEIFIPYYNHSETNQTLLEGSADFIPLQLSTDAFGFLLTRRPFTLNAEYHKVESNINPSSGWSADLNYNDNIFVNTQLQGGARVSSTYYPEGTSKISGESYTLNLWTLSLGIQQRVPKKNMFLFLGGSYTQEHGLGETTTYSLNSSFVWKIGKLFITAGGSTAVADSTINGINNNRSTQNYYLTVKRQLF